MLVGAFMRLATNPRVARTGLSAVCPPDSRERSASTIHMFLLRFFMRFNQRNPHKRRVDDFVSSELFQLMLDVTHAYGSYGYRSYCVAALMREGRINIRERAEQIVDRELARREPRQWSVGGAA